MTVPEGTAKKARAGRHHHRGMIAARASNADDSFSLERPLTGSASPPDQHAEQPTAEKAKRAVLRSHSYAAAYIIQRRIGRSYRHTVINRAVAGSGKVTIAPHVDHAAAADVEHQSVDIEKAAMDWVVGRSCGRAARVEEVVIGKKTVGLRVQAGGYREPTEIIGSQQIGRFRHVVLDYFESADRHIDEVEAIIRVREGAGNSGDLKGSDLLKVPIFT